MGALAAEPFVIESLYTCSGTVLLLGKSLGKGKKNCSFFQISVLPGKDFEQS
jgi:hypothetical protein